MGNVFQTDGGRKRFAVLKEKSESPIVGAKEVLQYQAGKQLMLREFLWAVFMSMSRKTVLRNFQRT